MLLAITILILFNCSFNFVISDQDIFRSKSTISDDHGNKDFHQPSMLEVMEYINELKTARIEDRLKVSAMETTLNEINTARIEDRLKVSAMETTLKENRAMMSILQDQAVKDKAIIEELRNDMDVLLSG